MLEHVAEKDVESFMHPDGGSRRRAAHHLQSRKRNEVAQGSRHADHDTSCGIIRKLFADGTGFPQEGQRARGENRAGFRNRDSGSTSNHELLTEIMLELRKGSA
jgi:hypothetical protein